MLVTQLHARCVWDGTAIMHPDHFIVGVHGTAIEVRRPENKFDVHFHTKLFKCLPPHRLYKAFPLLKATGDTLWLVYDAEAWRCGRYPPPWEDSPVWACVTWQATAETGQLPIKVSKTPRSP
jgi:hypothetical protein